MSRNSIRNLRILHIISSWENGLSRELIEFTTRLSHSEIDSEKIDSEICVLNGKTNRYFPSVPTTSFHLRSEFDFSTHFGLRRLCRRFRPDIIHTWDPIAHFFGALHSGTVPLIAEIRDADSPQRMCPKFIDRKTSRYIVPRQDHHFSRDKTMVIPPAAVPMPYAEPMPAEELLTKLGISQVEPEGDYYPVFQPTYDSARRNYVPSPPQKTPFIIGIILPLSSEHRILDALWVFETFNHVHLNYHAFVIGDGKDREMLLRCRDRWNLFPRVHFFGDHSDADRLLPSFDVLLHLSPSAECAGSILSAMSCGVPVIALETPESREFIVDGTTGILIPSEGDFRFCRRTTTKRLLYLCENEELRCSMRTAAKERVTEKYNFTAADRQRIQVYREICR